MTKKILILPGDGIGQEVTASAVEVLNFIVEKFNLQFSISSMEVGGTAYDKFGSPIPDNVLDAAKEADAVLFGAVGGPKWDDLDWDDRPENALPRDALSEPRRGHVDSDGWGWHRAS